MAAASRCSPLSAPWSCAAAASPWRMSATAAPIAGTASSSSASAKTMYGNSRACSMCSSAPWAWTSTWWWTTWTASCARARVSCWSATVSGRCSVTPASSASCTKSRTRLRPPRRWSAPPTWPAARTMPAPCWCGSTACRRAAWPIPWRNWPTGPCHPGCARARCSRAGTSRGCCASRASPWSTGCATARGDPGCSRPCHRPAPTSPWPALPCCRRSGF